jgi:hypothetical protein
MICRRYFPGFCDVSDEERFEQHIEHPDDALKIDWIQEKIKAGWNVTREGAFIMSVYPDAKYPIALLLTDDKKDYAKCA